MRSAEDIRLRYYNDTAFHALVNAAASAVIYNQFTEEDLEEAMFVIKKLITEHGLKQAIRDNPIMQMATKITGLTADELLEGAVDPAKQPELLHKATQRIREEMGQ